MQSWKRVTSLVSKDTLILALVLAVAVGGTSAVLEATVEHLLHHDAAATARAWASYLAKNVWDLEDIVGGKNPSIDSQRFFDRAQQVGQVFRYKVYDPTGRLRLVSDEIGRANGIDQRDRRLGAWRGVQNGDDREVAATEQLRQQRRRRKTRSRG